MMYSAVAISDSLRESLYAWNAAWEQRTDPLLGTMADDAWLELWTGEGRHLAGRLASETGARVVYWWPNDGRDDACVHCGRGT